MAVGGCAQACALHKAGPGRLCCSAISWHYTAWYPLDACWTRVVDHGVLPTNGLSVALYAHGWIKITNLVKSGGPQPSRVQVKEHVELSVSSDQEQQPMQLPSPQAISPELPVDQAKHHPGMPASCAISHQLNQCFSRPPSSRIMIPQPWTSRTSSHSPTTKTTGTPMCPHHCISLQGYCAAESAPGLPWSNHQYFYQPGCIQCL